MQQLSGAFPFTSRSIQAASRDRYQFRRTLLAKKGPSGRMQRPPELLPIREYLHKASAGTGKLLHFGKMPKHFGKNLAKL